jgi:hypothetical protein
LVAPSCTKDLFHVLFPNAVHVTLKMEAAVFSETLILLLQHDLNLYRHENVKSRNKNVKVDTLFYLITDLDVHLMQITNLLFKVVRIT